MKKIKHLLFALLFSFLFFCEAQAQGVNMRIDSLKALVDKHTATDTTAIRLMNSLAFELYSRNPKEMKNYAERSLKLASEINDHKGKAASLWLLGMSTLSTDRKASLGYYEEAIKIAEVINDKAGLCNYLIAKGNLYKSMGDITSSNKGYEKALATALEIADKKAILKSRINLAMNLSVMGNYIEAVKQIQEAISMGEEEGDTDLLPKVYSMLASIYRIHGNYVSAIEYYFLALKFNEQNHDYNGVFLNLINIGCIKADQKDTESGLETFNKALQMAEEQKDSSKISVCYTNIGTLYLETDRRKAVDYLQKAINISAGKDVRQNIYNFINIGAANVSDKNFDQASEYFSKALQLSTNSGYKNTMGEVYAKTGDMYAKWGKNEKALEATSKALAIATEIKYLDLQKDCYKQLAEIYAANKNFKAAYENQERYKTYADSIYNENNVRKIALLESSYKFEKEKRMLELEKNESDLRIKNQQQSIRFLIIISILGILLALFIYWYSRLKKKLLRMEIENINNELELNQKESTVDKLKLLQNNERDAYHIKLLQDIEQHSGSSGQKSLDLLLNSYKLNETTSNWDEFETMFTKVNTSFWNRLNELYPNLTPNEKKLCIFLKLNMKNKDIAQITLQSEEALKKSRLRLRKKLALDRSINLSAHIQSL